MKRNMMRRNLHQSIRRSLGRYIAIAGIIALGVGFFTGLRVTKSDMIATCQRFTDELCMFDLRLLNTYGWTDRELAAVSQLPDVAEVEADIMMDVLLNSADAEDTVYRLHRIPERINQVRLTAGRMPVLPSECLADGYYGGSALLGSQLTVSPNNTQDTRDALTCDTYTVVGCVSTPLYLNMERGNSRIGNGTVSAYLYLPASGFQADTYTDLYVKLPGTYDIYSEAFEAAVDSAAERLEAPLDEIVQQRFSDVRVDAEKEYADGVSAYEDGVRELADARVEAEAEFAKAEQKIKDGQKELDENRKKLEDGRAQLEEAEKPLNDAEKTLAGSRKTLMDTRSETYQKLADGYAELAAKLQEVSESRSKVADGLAQIADGLSQLDSGISTLRIGMTGLNIELAGIQGTIRTMDAGITAAEKALDHAREQGMDENTLEQLRAELTRLEESRDTYLIRSQEVQDQLDAYSDQMETLLGEQAALLEQQSALRQTDQTLEAALNTIQRSILEAESGKMQAESQFAEAEAELESAQAELDAGRAELEEKRIELESGEAAFAQAERELADGKKEFAETKEQTIADLNQAQRELDDAEDQLAQARVDIDNLAEPVSYTLSRSTNLGYSAFESDSDIVSGISKVFPLFFLSVAALVCITTMTRMVEEERTQIGTLKALGYGSWRIAWKYLAYSGGSAILGCGLGVAFGCTLFPQILWRVYDLLYNMEQPLVLLVDIPLCTVVTAVYLALILGVTYGCCRAALRQVPAELIRPKAPLAGKKLIMEHLPLNRMGFLNKVAARNVFRYRQRLAMMLLGIGGCTALLVTGIGLQASISRVVDVQFSEVTLYDIGATFSQGQTPQERADFITAVSGEVERVQFCHVSGVDLTYHGSVKEVNLLASDPQLEQFIDLHSGKKQLHMPERDQALVNIGLARNLGLSVGDTITVRNGDMETMELTVSGIFDNLVYDYVVVSEETYVRQLGHEPPMKTAYMFLRDGADPHLAGMTIGEQPDVRNTQINADLARQVGTTMESMNGIVVMVLVCAICLAVIVLYNLTNINIKEREREIATIKVLGFYPGESAAYVFKENTVLSMMGAVLGLFGGRWLETFVIDQIRLDRVYFAARMTPMGYGMAVLITLLTAAAVDFVLYFKMERINMAEALKSIE